MQNRIGVKMWLMLTVLVASLAVDAPAHAVQTATFPVPLPTYKPLLTPVYAWESENPSGVMAADSKYT